LGGEKEEEAREDWTEEARERKSLGREESMRDRSDRRGKGSKTDKYSFTRIY